MSSFGQISVDRLCCERVLSILDKSWSRNVKKNVRTRWQNHNLCLRWEGELCWTLTPWVLCWHIHICHYVATPLSAVLTYTYMSWYHLWENLHKIGCRKDFLMNFFLFACCFAKEPTGKQTENIATIFHTPFRWKKEKNTKSSAQWAYPLIWMSAVKGLIKTIDAWNLPLR